MCRVFKFEVTESPATLEALLQKENAVRRRERLQLLYGYQPDQAKTRQAWGKLWNRSQFALGQGIDTYRHRGLHGLVQLHYRGGNLAPSIPGEIQGPLKETLGQPEGFSSYTAIHLWLKETQDLEVPDSTVFGTVKYRLGGCLPGPRPYAVDYDPDAVEDFKKNCSRPSKWNSNRFFSKIL